MAKRKSEHYVDNKKFTLAVIQYNQECEEQEKLGKPVPRIPDYIGDCFLRIATRYSNKHNTSRYPYRDEMIYDAALVCCQYLRNFDPAKSMNAFAYFTQYAKNAFSRRINIEKKELYVKCLSLRNELLDAETARTQSNNYYVQISDEYIDNYEKARENRKKRKKNPVLVLDDFIAEFDTKEFEDEGAD